jgi:precorrin-3B synthase
MASPLGRDDPTSAFDSHEAAREIEAMLGEEAALAALPDKFGILVDAGGVLPLAGATADIMIRADGNALIVQLDGGTLAIMFPRSRLAETVQSLALASLHLAFARGEPPRRMRKLISDVGEEAIFRAAGIVPADMPSTPPMAAPIVVGFIPYAAGYGAFGAGLPFGRIDADQLASLAHLAERFGDGCLRTTPWRALLIANVATADANAVSDEVASLGLIADPSDPRLRIFACVGKPACPSATVDARGDATRIAAILGKDGRETLHVSGCVKSCAHRGCAALTLVGRDGRYDLIRNGMASDRPSLTGLCVDEILALAGVAREHVP